MPLLERFFMVRLTNPEPAIGTGGGSDLAPKMGNSPSPGISALNQNSAAF